MGQSESSAADEPPAKRPCALVVVGPSGVGKGTLINKLMSSSTRFGFSCSHTTRAPRPGEKDGEHYHFTTREAFESGIERGDFLEHAHVHANIYGTSVQAVRALADDGRCCVLDIDVQGARQIREAGLPAVFVFIAPPSMEELEARLRRRATDSEEQIQTRLAAAREEMDSRGEEGLYDYILVNDDLDRTFAELAAIASRALAGESPSPGGTASAVFAAGGEDPAGAAGDEEAAGSPAAPSVMVLGADGPAGERLVRALCAARSAGRVVAVGADARRMERLQAEVLRSGGAAQRFLPVVADVTKEDEARALPRIVADRWEGGALDAVVICALPAPGDALELAAARKEPVKGRLAAGLVGPSVAVAACLADAPASPLQVLAVTPAEPSSGWDGLAQAALVHFCRGLVLETPDRVAGGVVRLRDPASVEALIPYLAVWDGARRGLLELTL